MSERVQRYIEVQRLGRGRVEVSKVGRKLVESMVFSKFVEEIVWRMEGFILSVVNKLGVKKKVEN